MRALLVLLLCGPLTALTAHAADAMADFDRARRRSGVWVSLGAAVGALSFASDTAAYDASVDGLATLGLGVDLWPEDHLGLYLGAQLGLGASLETPSLGVALDYNVHQVDLGARYRWHLGPQPTALAPFVAVGLRVVRQETQDQVPALLVRSTSAGPEFAAGLEWPLAGERLWLRVAGRLGLPFFLRESPDDSGDPQDFIAFGGRLEAIAALTGPWSAQAQLDVQTQQIRFQGEGTRAASVFGARTEDRFVVATLGVRRSF